MQIVLGSLHGFRIPMRSASELEKLLAEKSSGALKTEAVAPASPQDLYRDGVRSETTARQPRRLRIASQKRHAAGL